MAVAHKGGISFGLVYIPIELHRTTIDHDISFNQLCKETHERVHYKKYCAGCEKELKPTDIVKGYQYEKDQYVIMTDDEIDKLKVEKDRTINILHFTKLEDIDDLFYEKNYYVIPDKKAEKAYELLRTTMESMSVVAIAKSVIGTKETLMALCPEKDCILVKTLFYEDEIADIPKEISKPKIAKQEVDVAKQLIQSMMQKFKPDDYQDEFQIKLREAIGKKIDGKQVTKAKSKKAEKAPVDLMDALKQSLVANNKKPKQRKVAH